MAVTLRTLTDSDLDTLFVWESDPRAVRMAAFTRANPSDRSEFDAHYERIRNEPLGNAARRSSASSPRFASISELFSKTLARRAYLARMGCAPIGERDQGLGHGPAERRQ